MNASHVKNRFFEELEFIQRYVEFARFKSAVFDHEVREIINLLRKFELPEVEISRERDIRGEPYSRDELQKLVDHLNGMSEELSIAITETQDRIEGMNEPPGLNEIDVRSIVGEWIQFMIDELDPEQSDEHIMATRKAALVHIKSQEWEDPNSNHIDDRQIDYAIDAALYVLAVRKLHSLFYLKDKTDDLEVSLKIEAPESEINIHKQGFILLMAHFDAAVFDIVRIALSNQFFQLIGAFGRTEKLSLSDFSSYTSYENFRDRLIEDTLKKLYLKEIIFTLNRLGVSLFSPRDVNGYAQLIELINRRNIILHNRGRVDERYLDRDDQGVPRYNLFDLSLGEITYIDLSYWSNVTHLCKDCISNLSIWADSLST
jgi:hypothetical protein